MSRLLLSARTLLRQTTKSQAVCETSIIKRWDATATAAHTLGVRKRIEEARQKALLGGGQKRIDRQHKRVQKLSNN